MTGRQLKQIIERSGIRTNAFAEKMSISPQSLNSVFNQELPDKVTTYWARHSWATIAASLDIPDDVISQALGHSSHNATTSVYIQRDQKKVDIATAVSSIGCYMGESDLILVSF